MYRIEKTAEFENWLDGLRDRVAQRKVAIRLARVESGLFGDWKALGDGISEFRIDYGPGYRLYFTMRGQVIVVLLSGSDKRDQSRAITLAKQLAKRI